MAGGSHGRGPQALRVPLASSLLLLRLASAVQGILTMAPNPVCNTLSVHQKELCGETVDKKYVLPLLVTGSGGSGTHSISEILKDNGIDALHEAVGKDGAVSWPYAVDAAMHEKLHDGKLVYWGPTKSRFEKVFHLVRCPIDSISSMTSHLSGSYRYIWDNMEKSRPSKILGEWHADFDAIEQKASKELVFFCMRAWLEWNRHVDRYADRRFRIDQIKELVDASCEVVTSSSASSSSFSDCGHSRTPVYENHRDHASLGWKDLSEIDPLLTEAIRQMAIDYGFDEECTAEDESAASFRGDHDVGSVCRDSVDCEDGIYWRWETKSM